MQHKLENIPPFDERGNLPTGIHNATIEEVVERFSNPKSLTRSKLVKNLRLFYEFIKPYATAIYVDGSFVTSKLSPNDIDLVVMISNKFRFNRSLQQQLYTWGKNRKQYRLHLIVLPESDLKGEAYWQQWFTMTRKDDHHNQFPKGIISLELNND